MTDSLITFDNHPLHEVALGQTFLHRPDFLIPYYGEFWALIRDRFPLVEHAAPILDAQEGTLDSFLPRVWFMSEDKHLLMQLQQDRFYLNWRRLDDKSLGGGYVRFPAVQEKCLALWSELAEFVEKNTSQPLQPVKAELTYTNLITLPGAKSPFEVAEATLAHVAWPRSENLPPPKGFSSTLSFPVNNGTDTLQVMIAAARGKVDGEPMLKVDLTVKSKTSPPESLEQWSNAAHRALVGAFRELTNAKMHEHWQLREM